MKRVILSSMAIAIVTSTNLALAKDQGKKEVVVYTARKEHLIKNIFKKYTEQTGVNVVYKTGKSAALIETIKAEGAKSKADIFMTVDAGNLWQATKEDLLTPVKSETLARTIPSHLRDTQNRWFGLSVRARTLVYNTNKITAKDLSTYEDLADKKWQGRICLRTSKKVYNQSLVAMLIHELGRQKAQNVVTGWAKNAADIHSNDTSVLKAVAAGQCDVGIVNTYYFGRLLKKDPKLPLKLFWPNQNKSYGVHVNISGAGVLKNSKNKKEAVKLIEWLAGQEAQKEFAQVNMEYPISNKAPQADATKNWGKFKANSSFPLTKAGELQLEAMKVIKVAKYK